MKIEFTPKFRRSLKKCEKRNWTLRYLEPILDSYISKGCFDDYEIQKYKDHALSGSWEGYREFHPKGKRSDWVVVYHVEENKLVLHDTGDTRTMVLDDTGTHDEIFGSYYQLVRSTDFKCPLCKEKSTGIGHVYKELRICDNCYCNIKGMQKVNSQTIMA